MHLSPAPAGERLGEGASYLSTILTLRESTHPALREFRLAVEIDGGQHYEDAGRRYDQSRDEALKAMGIRTLRFSNLDVLRETEGVAEAIWGEVQRLTDSEWEAPSPDLLYVRAWT